MHVCAAGGEKLGLPCRGLASSCDNHPFALQGPEDRQLGKQRHTGAAFRLFLIPLLLQDNHR
ncbi:hypothetical protein D3C87_2067390 [compost metagenome]